ncbi:MAG: hypothetical protein Q8R28_03105, partial [Dehalococcoidia bacterium]|nr:hypothetical protein [Dehalococcoidia bacterium]
KVTAVDAGTLSPQRRAVLQVSRALCQDFSPSISSIEAAQIPPASQRVRTAGLYNRGTGQMYVALEQLDRGKSAIDTVIHEMAHHTSGADDGELAHAEEIKNLAGKVVASVASRKYDALLKNPEFTW